MRKSLLSLIAGISLLVPTAKAVTNDVYTSQWFGTDVQSVIDSSQSGDVIDIRAGGYWLAFTGGWVVDNKDLTFISTDGVMIRQSAERLLTATGNSNVRFEGLNTSGDYNPQTIVTEGQSSFVSLNGGFTNGKDYITKNSSGDLIVKDTSFSGTEYFTQSAVVINNAEGQIDIVKNFIGWHLNPIVINSAELQAPMAMSIGNKVGTLNNLEGIVTFAGAEANPTLNILNNTISVAYDAGITINGTVDKTGYIANNNITDTPEAVRTFDGVPNIQVTQNNFYENLAPMQTMSLYSRLVSQGSNFPQSGNAYNNYSFDPLFYSAGYDPSVPSESPVYFKGLYIAGKTTYFPSANRTFIGSYGDTMPLDNPNPTAVPEPSTVGLIAMGGALLYLANKNKRGK